MGFRYRDYDTTRDPIPSIHLNSVEAAQIAEVLRRYTDELLEQKRNIELYDADPNGDSYQIRKDIDYITGLRRLLGDTD